MKDLMKRDLKMPERKRSIKCYSRPADSRPFVVHLASFHFIYRFLWLDTLYVSPFFFCWRSVAFDAERLTWETHGDAGDEQGVCSRHRCVRISWTVFLSNFRFSTTRTDSLEFFSAAEFHRREKTRHLPAIEKKEKNAKFIIYLQRKFFTCKQSINKFNGFLNC